MAISINPMALLGDEAVRAKQAVMAALEEETGDTSAETSSGSKSGTTSFAATFTSAMDDVNEYLEDPADEAIIEATSANASGSLGDIGIFTVDARTIPLLDGVYTGTIEDDELKYEFTGVQKDIFRLLRFLVTTHETDGTITDIDEAMAALGWDEVTDEHEAADTVIDFYRSLDYTNLGVTYDVLYDYTDQLFEDVFDLELYGFNHQNAISCLNIESIKNDQGLDCLAIEIDPAFGLGASFKAAKTIIKSVEPTQEGGKS